MAGCYWGMKTRANKVAWAVLALLVLVGVAFWVPGILMTRKCIDNFKVCSNQYQSVSSQERRSETFKAAPLDKRTQQCLQEYKQCVTTPAVLWGIGWLLFVCSWIPCFYFCCCSRNPAEVPQNQQAGMVVYTPGPAQYPVPGVQLASPYPAYPYNGGLPPGQPYPMQGQPYPVQGQNYNGTAASYPPAVGGYPNLPQQPHHPPQQQQQQQTLMNTPSHGTPFGAQQSGPYPAQQHGFN